MKSMDRRIIILVLVSGLSLSFAVGANKRTRLTATRPSKQSLKKALTELKIPPDWFGSVKIDYDTNQPWSEARQEIRRLLDEGDKQHIRQAIKLTCIYQDKKDIGDGHEYPLYLFMGREYAWAVKAYEEFLKANPKGYTRGYLALASCYKHFGEYEKACRTIERAMKNLPDPPWGIASKANCHEALGDTYAEMGDLHNATGHYKEAARLYPQSKQPYGRHRLPQYVKKVQRKSDMLVHKALASGKLKDGSYTCKVLGYVDFIGIEVEIKSGKIADIKLDHYEKLDLDATKIIPKQIIDKQSLEVDAVTGATITSDAIIGGTFLALKKAEIK